jgi:hypothetical protein
MPTIVRHGSVQHGSANLVLREPNRRQGAETATAYLPVMMLPFTF